MKAKLVIDMPENCDECRFLVNYENGENACCAHIFTRCFIDEEYDILDTKRMDWCPLEPFETIGDYLRGTD